MHGIRKACLALVGPSRSSLRAICSNLDLTGGDSMLPQELEPSLPSSAISGLLCSSELGCCSSQAASPHSGSYFSILDSHISLYEADKALWGVIKLDASDDSISRAKM